MIRPHNARPVRPFGARMPQTARHRWRTTLGLKMETLRSIIASGFLEQTIDPGNDQWHRNIPNRAGWYYIETDGVIIERDGVRPVYSGMAINLLNRARKITPHIAGSRGSEHSTLPTRLCCKAATRKLVAAPSCGHRRSCISIFSQSLSATSVMWLR